jgi:D-alanyl-D-alanine dipeptidase
MLFAHVNKKRMILPCAAFICQLLPAIMTFRPCGILALFALASPARAQFEVPVPQALAVSKQMVLVTASNWTSTNGLLRRFERSVRGWEIDGPPFRVVLGRRGLGWGRGMQPFTKSEPQKREGDGRSPAGIFALPYAFGYAPADSVSEIKLQYVQCTASLECVDDTNSSHYNAVVDRTNVTVVDWKSSEKMRMSDDEYRLGIFVDQNTLPAAPGGGSCVFMHIWKGPDIPTSGCTAMSEGEMEALLGWLDGQAHPVLVQLPDSEFQRYQQAWALPALEVKNAPGGQGTGSGQNQ